MCPTAVANSVIDDVQAALQQLQISLSKAQIFDESTTYKSFKIALHSTVESSYFPKLTHLTMQTAPQIKLASVRITRHELYKKLTNGDIDLAVDVLLPPDPDICHCALEQDKLVVIANKAHKIIKHKLSLTTYRTQKHLLVSSRAQGSSIEDFELGRLGIQREVSLRCQHLFSACQIVANSQMLLTLPQSAAKLFSQILPLAIYPLPVKLPAIDIHLYWHKNAEQDPANKWLRKKILLMVKAK
jgi:DNA-binding transcriptional LysR family regulator